MERLKVITVDVFQVCFGVFFVSVLYLLSEFLLEKGKEDRSCKKVLDGGHAQTLASCFISLMVLRSF